MLTKKESELLKHLENGSTVKEAGVHMAISLHTVDFHIRNIKRKLEVKTITAAVALAIRSDYL
ncbi:MAG: helix-turn-helix transcriptional regulator [Gammaproteobacteria bacterium]|nr:helix-turn-helix transcriptional regulator [Gammaproteobacteria bacterium]